MNDNTVTYRLYVLKLNAENIKKAMAFRFYRINERYVLIYSAETIADAPEITEQEVWRLNETEREWLGLCNVQLLIEDAQQRKDEIQQNLAERLRKLEEELEKETLKAQN